MPPTLTQESSGVYISWRMHVREARRGLAEGRGTQRRSARPRSVRPRDHLHETHRSSIMNVGRRVDYAVRALCYLAAQPAHRVVPRS